MIWITRIVLVLGIISCMIGLADGYNYNCEPPDKRELVVQFLLFWAALMGCWWPRGR